MLLRLAIRSSSTLPAAFPQSPPLPSLNSPDLLSSSFPGSAAVGSGCPLLPPGRRRGLGPRQPRHRLCAGWVAQGALQTPRPHGQPEHSRSQSHPPPPWLRATSHFGLCGEAAAGRASARWCFWARYGAPCHQQEAAAGFTLAWHGTLPQQRWVWGFSHKGADVAVGVRCPVSGADAHACRLDQGLHPGPPAAPACSGVCAWHGAQSCPNPSWCVRPAPHLTRRQGHECALCVSCHGMAT